MGGPLVIDVLGYRVNGWFRHDDGYVDRTDPVTDATLDANANQNASKAIRAA